MSKKNKGFTLIELLVVIAIIGILASIILASLNSARRKSRDARRIADLKQIQLALEMYFDKNSNHYPTSIAALVTDGDIAAEPKDPMGNYSYAYAYAPPAPATSPTYYHLGAALEEGTNSALNSDKDCDSSVAGSCPYTTAAYTGGFPGCSGTPCNDNAAQTNGCGNSNYAGKYCYDIVP